MSHQQLLSNLFITSMLNGMLACLRALHALSAWQARVQSHQQLRKNLFIRSMLNGMLACSRALHAVSVWQAHVLYILTFLVCFTRLSAWRAHILYEVGVLACLTYFKKIRKIVVNLEIS